MSYPKSLKGTIAFTLSQDGLIPRRRIRKFTAAEKGNYSIRLSFIHIRLIHPPDPLLEGVFGFEAEGLDAAAVEEFFGGSVGVDVVEADLAPEADDVFNDRRQFFYRLVDA